MLIVNTASACGFTLQFAGLDDLHKAHGDKGLVVREFPCNRWGAQDKDSNGDGQTFQPHGVQPGSPAGPGVQASD